MRTMLKALSLTVALSAPLGLALAKEPAKNVSKDRHPNLAAAQKLIGQAFDKLEAARKQIVATKAACQLFSHGLKLAYFGALIEQSGSVEPWFAAIAIASSMIGTSAGKLVLEKLTDTQFRAWSNRIITVIATYYIGYGVVLLTGIA